MSHGMPAGAEFRPLEFKGLLAHTASATHSFGTLAAHALLQFLAAEQAFLLHAKVVARVFLDRPLACIHDSR